MCVHDFMACVLPTNLKNSSLKIYLFRKSERESARVQVGGRDIGRRRERVPSRLYAQRGAQCQAASGPGHDLN